MIDIPRGTPLEKKDFPFKKEKEHKIRWVGKRKILRGIEGKKRIKEYDINILYKMF